MDMTGIATIIAAIIGAIGVIGAAFITRNRAEQSTTKSSTKKSGKSKHKQIADPDYELAYTDDGESGCGAIAYFIASSMITLLKSIALGVPLALIGAGIGWGISGGAEIAAIIGAVIGFSIAIVIGIFAIIGGYEIYSG